MQLHNTYYWFQNAFTPEECNKIISIGLKDIETRKKQGENVYGTVAGNIHKGSNKEFVAAKADLTTEEIKKKNQNYEEEKFYVRDSKVAWLNEKFIYDRVEQYVNEANKKTTWNWQWDHMEAAQFTVYEKGGFYGWHSDGNSDWSATYKKYIPGVTTIEEKKNRSFTNNPLTIGKVRKISVTINLSEENTYEGGLLKFDFGPHSSIRFKECTEIKKQGSMIVFPSFQYHQVTPVTKGTRYSLVVWVLGRPFQ
jgi:PKHD-type hydroxylase